MFKSGAYFDRLKTLQDGSVQLVFSTQEVASQALTELIQMRQAYGNLYFSELVLADDAIHPPESRPGGRPVSPAGPVGDNMAGRRSYSQRLRGDLYHRYKLEIELEMISDTLSFDDYYAKAMEPAIAKVQQDISRLKKLLDSKE